MSDVLNAILKVMDDRDMFRQGLVRTARDRGFPEYMVEKDFFCSLILVCLAERLPDVAVFKGGTCLSKVFADFYRLSEDLDFSVSVRPGATRSERRVLMEPVKALCLDIPAACPGFAMIAPIRGANESTQYVQRLGYTSLFSTARSEIKIEFGVREELIMRPLSGEAQTLLLNPLTGDSWVEPFRVRVMARDEMWSEKARAALCRREPAIRDFYDMDFGLRSGQVDIADPRFVSLVRRKTSVPGNKLVKMTEERRAELERQKNAELRAVLRGRDFERFDLGRIWDSLTELSGRL